MRRIALTCAILLATAACGTSSPDDGDGTGEDRIAATVGLATWVPASANGAYQDGFLTLTGTSQTSETFSISLFVSAPGTFNTGTANPTFAATYSTGAGATWVAGSAQGSGSVTITTFTTHGAEGTFHFVMAPTSGGASGNKEITLGSFAVTF